MRSKFLTSALTFSLISTSAYAIEFSKLAGVEEILPYDKRHLSPIYPQAMKESEWLKKMRFFGPYGDEAQANLASYDQIKSETDLPQSPLARQLQFLFPSPDGLTFVPNNRMHFILNTFGVATLGEVFAAAHGAGKEQDIAEFLKTKASSNKGKQAKELGALLYSAFHGASENERLLARYAFMYFALEKCVSKSDLLIFMTAAGLVKPDAFGSEEEKNNWLVREFTKKDYDQFKEGLDCDVVSKEEVQQQKEALRHFLKKSFPEDEKDTSHPKPSKQEVGESDNNPSAEEEKLRVLLDQRLQNLMRTVVEWRKQKPSAEQKKKLLASPEHLFLVGAGAKRYEKPTLIVPYGNASFKEFSFSDCAEAGLFSLVNTLLYDPEMNALNLKKLPATAIQRVRDFYQVALSQGESLSSLRAKWSQMMSDLPHLGIKYVAGDEQVGRYELASSLGNLVTALEYLFGFEHESGLSLKERWSKVVGAFKYDETQAFSLDSDLDEDSLKNGELTLVVDERPILKISSSGNHTSVESFDREKSWTMDFGRSIFPQVFEREDLSSLLLLSLYGDSTMLNTALTADYTPEEKKKYRDLFSAVALYYPLESTDGKFILFDLLLKLSSEEMVPHLMGTLMRLQFNDEVSLELAGVLMKQNEDKPDSPILTVMKKKIVALAESRPLLQFLLSFYMPEADSVSLQALLDPDKLSFSDPVDITALRNVLETTAKGAVISEIHRANLQDMADEDSDSEEGFGNESGSGESQSDSEAMEKPSEMPEFRYLMEMLEKEYHKRKPHEQRKIGQILGDVAATLSGEGCYGPALYILDRLLSFSDPLSVQEEIDYPLSLFLVSDALLLEEDVLNGLSDFLFKYVGALDTSEGRIKHGYVLRSLLGFGAKVPQENLLNLGIEILKKFPSLITKEFEDCVAVENDEKKHIKLLDFILNGGNPLIRERVFLELKNDFPDLFKDDRLVSMVYGDLMPDVRAALAEFMAAHYDFFKGKFSPCYFILSNFDLFYEFFEHFNKSHPEAFVGSCFQSNVSSNKQIDGERKNALLRFLCDNYDLFKEELDFPSFLYLDFDSYCILFQLLKTTHPEAFFDSSFALFLISPTVPEDSEVYREMVQFGIQYENDIPELKTYESLWNQTKENFAKSQK